LARKVPAVMARLCVDEKGMGRGQNLEGSRGVFNLFGVD
jgi:hypothetical protein